VLAKEEAGALKELELTGSHFHREYKEWWVMSQRWGLGGMQGNRLERWCFFLRKVGSSPQGVIEENQLVCLNGSRLSQILREIYMANISEFLELFINSVTQSPLINFTQSSQP
jgi:hypothetical protein